MAKSPVLGHKTNGPWYLGVPNDSIERISRSRIDDIVHLGEYETKIRTGDRLVASEGIWDNITGFVAQNKWFVVSKMF